MGLCLSLATPALLPSEARAFDWIGRIELDAEGLSSEDPKERHAAVLTLQKYAIEWTKEYLLRALDDPSPLVRAEAGRALAKKQVKEAIPILASWLAEPDPQTKAMAAQILGEMGASEAIPSLIRSLGDPDFTVRMRSTNALGKIGGDAVIIALVTRLEDTKSEVRLAAVTQLKALGDARAVIPLVGLFKDTSLNVRVAAHEAVGNLSDAASVPALLRSLSSRDDRIRLATITSLGNLHALAALPKLMSELTNAQQASYGKMAYSIAQIAAQHPSAANSKAALTALIEDLSDRHRRSSAKEALLTAGDAAVPMLIASLNGTIPSDSTAVVELLLQIGNPQATPALIAELDRGRISQKLVLSGLQQLGDQRALLPILSLLEDTDPKVRLRALQTLHAIGGHDSESADLVVKRLQDPSPEIQRLAIRYLGMLQSQSSATALEKIAKEATDLELRAEALTALAAIHSTTSTGVALDILQNGPSSLRVLAADVLSEIASPAALPPLLKMLATPNLPWKHLVIDAVGCITRGTKNDRARKSLKTISKDSNTKNALAAIEALAAMKDSPKELFRQLAVSAEPSRRNAALVALGASGDSSAKEILESALHDANTATSAAAAWALAQLAIPSSKPALQRATRSRSMATVVNASAALARLATKNDKAFFISLLRHHNPLVRVNALQALGKLGKDLPSKRMAKVLSSDASWVVRKAALEVMSQHGLKTDLKDAQKDDPYEHLRELAGLLLDAPFSPQKRTQWATFRIVDPDLQGTPLPQSARFFIPSDGLARVSYSDKRGRITYEHFPEGEFVQGAMDDLSRY